MNHTDINDYFLHPKAKEEAIAFLDATDIGIDDTFIVTTVEDITEEQFKERVFFRVPCTVGKAYIKKYIPRNSYTIYRLAYKATFTYNGFVAHDPFYRLIKLKHRTELLRSEGFPVDTESARCDYTYIPQPPVGSMTASVEYTTNYTALAAGMWSLR